jgi:hypothetical protein
MPRKKTNPKPVDEVLLHDDLVVSDERGDFVRRALTDWALAQFRDSRPCAITADHARSLRDRAGQLYDALIAPLED